MAIHQFPIATHQHRDLESKFADSRGHTLYGAIVFSWIPGVGDDSFDRPDFRRYNIMS